MGATIWHQMAAPCTSCVPPENQVKESPLARFPEFPSLEQANCRGRKIPAQLIAEAVIKAGYASLDQQAKALGVSRSTAWTIVNTKQKLGRLNSKTTRSILANPDTPASVRGLIEQILQPNVLEQSNKSNDV